MTRTKHLLLVLAVFVMIALGASSSIAAPGSTERAGDLADGIGPSMRGTAAASSTRPATPTPAPSTAPPSPTA